MSPEIEQRIENLKNLEGVDYQKVWQLFGRFVQLYGTFMLALVECSEKAKPEALTEIFDCLLATLQDGAKVARDASAKHILTN